MGKFGNLYLDLKSVNAIEFHGGSSSIIIHTGGSAIYYTPEYNDSDNPDEDYETICARRHQELVDAVISAKATNNEP